MAAMEITRYEGGTRGGSGRRAFLDGEPLVSIIIVFFNAAAKVGEVIESIINQPMNDCELIVVDGGSHDGTVEILQKYDSAIDHWISEADQGVFDAMNKGIGLATGKFIFHLNAGDTLLKIPRAELWECWHDGTSLASFRVLIDRQRMFVPRCNSVLRMANTLHHQGTFYRRDGFPKYDLAYLVYADFDLNQKLVLANAKVRLFDALVANHNTDGQSNSGWRFYEVFQIVRKNFGVPSVLASYGYFKVQGLKARLRRLGNRLRNR